MNERFNMNLTNYNDDSGDAALENLYPALVQCFATIICGYLAGRMEMISRVEAKGLNTFVSTFSLPCLIFLSLAQLNLTAVNWSFLLSILLAKTIVFISVILVAVCVSRPLHLGKPGLYAIFCTQSNDFAIGYPILEALYSKTHAEYPSYLYLMAPISLAILNPIAFILMELGQQQQITNSRRQMDDVTESALDSTQPSPDISPNASPEPALSSHNLQNDQSPNKLKLAANVLKSIVSNPIVFMTALGIIGNFCFSYLSFIIGILKVFGSAFSGTALFVLGLRMVGTVQKLKGDALLLPAVLIAVKLLALPLVTREVTSLIGPGVNASDTLDLSTFGFLYGTFPTAPAVFVFSTQYNLEVDMVSSAMVACTFVSAPLMFISAKMTSLDPSRPEHHILELQSFAFDLGIAGLLVGAWLLLLFIVNRKASQMPHKVTTCLVASQVLVCVGAILLGSVSDIAGESIGEWLRVAVLVWGVLSSRLWTAQLGVALLVLHSRSLCFLMKLLPWFVVVGCGLPVLLMMVVGIFGVADYNEANLVSPYFVYGNIQAVMSLIVLVLSFSVTSGCLVVLQRQWWKQARYQNLLRQVDAVPIQNNSSDRIPRVVDIEELASASAALSRECYGDTGCGMLCSEEARQVCSATLRQYRSAVCALPEADTELESYDPQIMRHMILLLLLNTSMFVGIMVCIWTLVSSDLYSGIYLELEFVDVTLTIGQIWLTFAVFGLDGWSVLSPIAAWWRKLWYGAETIMLPDIEDLSFETTHVCHQFIAAHLVACENDLARDIRSRLIVYKSCFKGIELVQWLVSKKLTKDETEAVTYASHLLLGRVLRHVENKHHFSHSNLLYTFRP